MRKDFDKYNSLLVRRHHPRKYNRRAAWNQANAEGVRKALEELSRQRASFPTCDEPANEADTERAVPY